MTTKEFKEQKRQLNFEYAKIFGIAPGETKFSCTYEQYIESLKEAIRTGKPLEELLPMVVSPKNPDLLT